jgi:phytoene desaturase
MSLPKEQQATAIVVGAGVAGLATAAHLAQRGLKVTVLEKNTRPGGRCDRIEREGYHFDTGPTLLVMPHLYESEFKQLGLSAFEALDLQQVDPTYHLYFEDGSTLALTSDLRRLGEQLERFEPGASAKLLNYLSQGGRNYELALERLVQRDFRRATDFFNLRNIPLLVQVQALTRHYPAMRAYFDDPRLKAAFTFQDMYMGLSPFEAPTTF